jgi:alpha-tubulin suppressor-like RCC1 family protein
MAVANAPVVAAGVDPVQRYIGHVYADLFDRSPDPTGLATWTTALNGGTPRIAVANAITYSSEYRSKLITGSYDHYLKRLPDSEGLANWLGAMVGGLTISQMESGFIASDEYYAKAGSTPEGWVTQLYTDVLGRGADPSEVAGWTTHLRDGMRRDQVAMGFLLSTERLSTVVDGHYQHLLGRGIDPSGQGTWVGILQAGGRDEAIIGGIIASDEYWNRNVMADTPGPVGEPVGDLTVVSATTTGVTLGWANPTAGGFTGVVVRRALGAVAPSTVASGTLAVATTGAVNEWSDTGLRPGETYSYALFAQYAGGTQAAAGTITVLVPAVASVTGTVLGAGGVRVGGVGVEVTTADGGQVAHATTGADGSYEVAGLVAGSYTVCFVPAGATGGAAQTGYLPQCWDQVAAGGAPIPVTVGAGGPVSGVDAALQTAGSVSGKVTNATGTPVAGVVVSVDQPGGDPVAFATTDTSGDWAVTGLDAGTYGVCFDPSTVQGTSYVAQCYDAVSPTSSPTPVTVTAHGATAGIDAILQTAVPLAAAQVAPASFTTTRVSMAAAATVSASTGVTVSVASPVVVIASTDLPTVACANVLFLGARGSGQSGPGGSKNIPGDPNEGLGGAVHTAYAELKAAITDGRTITPVTVTYPADNILPNVATLDYIHDLWQGVKQVRVALAARKTQCPNERIVLAGYSQGAMLMHRVLTNAPTKDIPGMDPSILARVDATILIADGDRVAHDTTQNYGTATGTAQGVGTQLDITVNVPKLATATGARTYSVCDDRDAVCDFSIPYPDPLVVVPVASDSYGAWVHTHHYDKSAIVRSAADAAAARVQSSLVFTTTDPLPTATIGVPYSVTFTATGGTPPYTYGFASTPPNNGLDTFTNGTWSGTPTTTGTYPLTIQATDAHGATTTNTYHLTIGVPGQTAYAWGDNEGGQLGDGTYTNRPIASQVGTDTHWAQVSAGYWHTVAVRTDGTLWAWGGNGAGQLGDGTTTNRLTPVQVGTDTHWAQVSAGMWHTVAVKTDGTLWAWGYNYYGELGDGTVIDRLSPVQVGVDTHWASVAAGAWHTVAVKTDGTLWTWGWNREGQLGDGSTTNQHAPMQVGTDTHWASVAAGYGADTVAVKTDGTLWAWGDNGFGQLGDGTTTARLTPVQVGTDTHWASVAAGAGHTVAVKTDGTLWAWGYNHYGELGDGTTTDRATPVQVGTDTHWARVAAGGEYTVALVSSAG